MYSICIHTYDGYKLIIPISSCFYPEKNNPNETKTVHLLFKKGEQKI